MKPRGILLAAILMMGITSFQSAQARQERFELNFNHSEFSGRSNISLKSALYQQYRINIDSYDLVAVQLEAKTKFGRGNVSLQVGSWVSMSQQVAGDPRSYDIFDPRTYFLVSLNNQSYDRFAERGDWALLFEGNFRVNRVSVILDSRFDGGPGRPGRPGRPGYPGHPGRPDRPPMPPPGGGGPVVVYERVVCYSNDMRFTACPIVQPGLVEYVRVIRQVSSASCDAGRTFGIMNDRRGIWTSGGCRAEFETTIRR